MKEIILGGDISVCLFIGGFLIYQHKVRKNTKLVLQKYEKTLNKAVDDNKNEFFVKEKIAILTKEEKEKFQKITEKLKQCNDSIYEFYRELSRHTEPESRRNFIRNITSASLEIADNKLQKNCDYESFYDQTKNKLTIYKQMPETLTILRLAKEEARRLGRNIVGTEMFLLGIIGEGTGIGGQVLAELEITMKDARAVVENMIGFGNEYYDREIVFTERAKRVLETAWELAKKDNKEKIESAHMLLALTTEPDSLAMKALEQLGVDAVEIKEGVKKFQQA